MSAGSVGALAQPGAASTARRLVVTWQHPITRSIAPVGLLTFDGHVYTFTYIERALSVTGFRPFLGFPDLHRRYESPRLFPLFAQRAMTPRRPDFTRWVTQLGLQEDATPWEQIARSGGRRHGDTIQLFPQPVIADTQMTCDFLIHGIRHVLAQPVEIGNQQVQLSRDDLERHLARLRPGDELLLRHQPHNEFNAHAILTTTTSDVPLGWVPDLLVDEIHRIPDRDRIHVTVQAANGPAAGWHLRLLAHLSAQVPPHFEVFTGAGWSPLA